MKLKTSTTALTFGFFVAVMHVVWMLMVYIGVAQTYLNWIFGIHLLSVQVRVLPFNLNTAITLVFFTFLIGYLVGWVFATVWNKVHKGN